MAQLSVIPGYWRFLGPRSAATTPVNSRVWPKLCDGPIPLFLAVHVCASFFDSKHAARVTIDVAHAKKNIVLARRCNELVASEVHFHISAHHHFSHVGNVGNEGADVAASLGMRGLISENNISICRLEIFIQRLLMSFTVSPKLLCVCTPYSFSCSWNSALCLVSRFFSEAFLQHFFCAMAEDLIWCSAQLPHPFKLDIRVQMWWQEEREAGVEGTAPLPPPPRHSHKGASGVSAGCGSQSWGSSSDEGRTLQQESCCDTAGIFKFATSSSSG